MNLDNSIEINVRTVKCSCNDCGKEFEIYKLSDFVYGERIILTDDGTECAYVNCFNDKVYNEVGKIVDSLYKSKKGISKVMIAGYFNKVFGLSCDLINGKNINAGRIRHTCSNCCSENIKIYEEKMSIIKKIIIPIITHSVWNEKSEKEKEKIIFDELKKRGYL